LGKKTLKPTKVFKVNECNRKATQKCQMFVMIYLPDEDSKQKYIKMKIEPNTFKRMVPT